MSGLTNQEEIECNQNPAIETCGNVENLDVNRSINDGEVEDNMNDENPVVESVETTQSVQHLDANRTTNDGEVGNDKNLDVESVGTSQSVQPLDTNRRINDGEVEDNINDENSVVESVRTSQSVQHLDATQTTNDDEVENNMNGENTAVELEREIFYDDNSSDSSSDVIVDSDAEIPRPQQMKTEDDLSGVIQFQLRVCF